MRRVARGRAGLLFTLAVTAALALGAPAAAAKARPATSAAPDSAGSPLRAWALRLRPGQDLRQGLLAFARARHLRAGAVLGCAGSLEEVNLRFANQPRPERRAGHFEIVSLSGTLDSLGGHLHLSVSDSTGATLGGHLWDGCRVYTTAEIVVADLEGVEFAREVDSTYGYRELVVRPRGPRAKRGSR